MLYSIRKDDKSHQLAPQTTTCKSVKKPEGQVKKKVAKPAGAAMSLDLTNVRPSVSPRKPVGKPTILKDMVNN